MYKSVIGLLLIVIMVLCMATAVFADDEWKVDIPQPGDVDSKTGAVEIESKGLSDMTKLFIEIVQWIFGIVGLVLGLVVLWTGVQIAFSGSNVKDRAELGSRIGKLVLGAGVCFGAWFFIGVMQGFFIK